MDHAWFRCPRCRRDWKVQITGDTVIVVPALERPGGASANHLPPKTEQGVDVKIITFTGDRVRGLEDVLAGELKGRTEDLGKCHLLLDFSKVEYLSSVEVETLIALHKKVRASGGRLTLFNLSAQVYEVFTVTRLQTLLGICREEAPVSQG
jgi:anti-sigma B factor antagonist